LKSYLVLLLNKLHDLICAPTVSQLEHLFKSILYTYSRLKELGFVYSNGIVSIIETQGENDV